MSAQRLAPYAVAQRTRRATRQGPSGTGRPRVVVHVDGGGTAYTGGGDRVPLPPLRGNRGTAEKTGPARSRGGGPVRQPDVIKTSSRISSGRRSSQPLQTLVSGARHGEKNKSKGVRIFSLSGHVKINGPVRGAARHHTLRELIDPGGGAELRPWSPVKFLDAWQLSTPMLTLEHLDIPLDLLRGGVRRQGE